VIDDLNMPFSCIFFFLKKGCLGSIVRRGIYDMDFIIVAEAIFQRAFRGYSQGAGCALFVLV